VARIKSAIKNIRKSRRRNAINRTRRGLLRTEIRRLRRLLERKDAGGARSALTRALSVIDRAVGKGVLHRNAAARHKSRLMRGLNALEKARTS
jgi:small subunit ribosomal protein S20